MRLFISIFLFYLISFDVSAQSWYSMNSGVTNSLGFGNSDVTGITCFQGKITIGGFFKRSTSQVLNGIAQWDDNQWQPMGIGVWSIFSGDSAGNGGFGLTSYNNKLYSAGIFDGAGGIMINDPSHQGFGITKWDISDWFPLTPGPLPAGVNSTATDLYVYKNNLYLSGFFGNAYDSSGNHPAAGIAKWNDTTFSSVGQLAGNFPPYGYNAAMVFTEHNNKLIVGGYFSSIDGSPYGSYSGIASWNDTLWSALSTGFNDAVFALTVFNGELYAGGKFTATGDNITPLNHIAKWSGSQWLAVGEGLNDTVLALCVDSVHNKLIAGGKFTQTGLGQPAKHIAEWDGINWQEIGGGTNDDVWALYEKDSNLYVGGSFSQAGTISANCIAIWGSNPVGINEVSKKNRKIKIYPNPNNGTMQLDYELSDDETGIVKIMDITDKLIATYVLEKDKTNIAISEAALKNGVYFYQIIVNGEVVNSDKLVIIKN